MAGQIALRAHPEVEGVYEVTLSHPGRLNAMSRAMWRTLREVFLALQAEPRARCVIVAGEGGAFCAGGDIAEYPDFRFDAAALRDFHESDVWGGLSALLDCDVPVVARIEGACMGAGVEIAACCDLRVAGASARFGAPIARLGFPMAPREAWLVRQAAGDATAREWLLEAAVLDAATVQARGFVQRVLPDDQVAAGAVDAARRIARLAPQAARLNKQALRLLRGPAPAAAPDAYAFADSAEHREGITAFLDKRPPSF
jgi:enoyl-CoA hydratase/carnithine racemase